MRDIVCNCQMVDRKSIDKAIHEKNATTIEEIRRYTGANTGCGKCISYINSILDTEVPKVTQKIDKTQASKFKLW
ncbi:(2Fe-2S)-binding protein [Labilibaculum sp. DW002]|jgi:NAD(P)H-nitrite reductase large subunit|uniref:Bacterioferritin-associated ferredoxin n=1 Tax=Paralabilibaculum antarcticum TaxID=2912572 RepID=A0ABT5VTR3_9BACT|nr:MULTISPECIES: (2Fe-2S)-binding protein [unclassified Labilibaculum]MBI9057068.1 (2Fe-2S)-binding protein [Labilibaculum sp.]MDE5417674.1 (2Fe-2S)-binding protein [Labilibaculum sp. DW002]